MQAFQAVKQPAQIASITSRSPSLSVIIARCTSRQPSYVSLTRGWSLSNCSRLITRLPDYLINWQLAHGDPSRSVGRVGRDASSNRPRGYGNVRSTSCGSNALCSRCPARNLRRATRLSRRNAGRQTSGPGQRCDRWQGAPRMARKSRKQEMKGISAFLGFVVICAIALAIVAVRHRAFVTGQVPVLPPAQSWQ